jgi:anaerobic selenocysteine-containing dehydrogenase
MNVDRRKFLSVAAAGASLSIAAKSPSCWLESLAVQQGIENPLAVYPRRDWERVYRDQYRYDSHFSWVCSPNDTHACRVVAYVRNGVIIRMGSLYESQTYADLYGNKATNNWNPRQCAKGYTFHRVVYAPYRLKYPLMRAGWKRWADDGFPQLTETLRTKYKFDARGQDQLVRVAWPDAFAYIAKAYQSIAGRYSGPEGAKLLLEQGYEPEMVEAMGGAGTRTCKFRGGMGLLGVLGKYGAYRLANSLALLDVKLRGVKKEEAKGGRVWSNYTWHGDQAPGHPWVHGLQTSDCDFNDLRFSKLIVMDGKNLVENKMTDSHWFIECMERGAKLVVITPEYGAPASKADYHIPIRPSTDAALFLGITRMMIERGWYDPDFVKRYTDFPLLVRTDDLKRLRAEANAKVREAQLKGMAQTAAAARQQAGTLFSRKDGDKATTGEQPAVSATATAKAEPAPVTTPAIDEEQGGNILQMPRFVATRPRGDGDVRKASMLNEAAPVTRSHAEPARGAIAAQAPLMSDADLRAPSTGTKPSSSRQPTAGYTPDVMEFDGGMTGTTGPRPAVRRVAEPSPLLRAMNEPSPVYVQAVSDAFTELSGNGKRVTQKEWIARVAEKLNVDDSSARTIFNRVRESQKTARP